MAMLHAAQIDIEIFNTKLEERGRSMKALPFLFIQTDLSKHRCFFLPS